MYILKYVFQQQQYEGILYLHLLKLYFQISITNNKIITCIGKMLSTSKELYDFLSDFFFLPKVGTMKFKFC